MAPIVAQVHDVLFSKSTIEKSHGVGQKIRVLVIEEDTDLLVINPNPVITGFPVLVNRASKNADVGVPVGTTTVPHDLVLACRQLATAQDSVYEQKEALLRLTESVKDSIKVP